MAKHVLLESYTFAPASRTVTINGRALRREQLLLITNVRTNTVIFNFADTSLTASSYVVSTANNVETTTIVLTYNTTSMSSTDPLSILVEETNESFFPAEAYRDPVEKFRTSQPQALIDTDFEYGTQPTKWESMAMMNNKPSAFYDPTNGISNIASTLTILGNVGSYQVTAMSGNGSRLVTITITNTTGITTNTPIYVQDSIDPNANGWNIPFSVTLNTSITYYARNNVTNGNIFDPTKTYLFVGAFYNQAGIAVSSTGGVAFTNAGTVVTVTTTNNHGLTAGQAVYVAGLTATTNPPNGSWYVQRTLNSNQFTFDMSSPNASIAAPTGTITPNAPGSSFTVNTTAVSGAIVAVVINAAGSGYLAGDIVTVSGGTGGQVKILTVSSTGAVTSIGIYFGGTGYTTASAVATTMAISCNTLFPKSWGYMTHRAFDGGVTFTAGYPYHGNQLIRQTRRYFRYQSGKGIQFSTGSNLCSPFQVDSMTASGTTVTVTTKYPHNLGVNGIIRVSNADQGQYNGTFTVTSIPTDLTFTYTALSAPGISPATCVTAGSFTVQPYQWYGASCRLGMFDNQNGLFFEYDGITLWAVRRNSTTQLQGYISLLYQGNQVVTGVGTRWAEGLIVGDFIVIRGQSYTVVAINSNTEMVIYPDYRGPAIVPPMQVIVSKTIDTKTAQSAWNIDKCDGTGESQFTLDVTKMQMWFIDYAWYGAGTVRWGIRDQRGTIRYVHRLAHGNAVNEAYMRSGNLPGRYEVNTFWPKTVATAGIGASDTSITVASTTGFSNTGTFIITGPANNSGTIEYVNYSGKTQTSFTGLTRGVINLTGPGAQTGMGGAATGQAFSYSTTSDISVSYWGPNAAVTISHWGSSVIMDGRYDDDKSIQFNFGNNTATTYGVAQQRYAVFSVRLAPAVDSGLTGVMGQREIINRMQLQPVGMDVYPTGQGVKVELWLNARVSQGTYVPVGGSSLAQYASHTTAATITGGECIFTFFAPAGAANSQDLSKVRDIGNSILGGGITNVVSVTDANKYPDGPDVLTLAVTPLAANAVVVARLNWTEAQA